MGEGWWEQEAEKEPLALRTFWRDLDVAEAEEEEDEEEEDALMPQRSSGSDMQRRGSRKSSLDFF